MSAGAILTLGLGAFSDVNHVVTLGYGVSSQVVTANPSVISFAHFSAHNVITITGENLPRGWL